LCDNTYSSSIDFVSLGSGRKKNQYEQPLSVGTCSIQIWIIQNIQNHKMKRSKTINDSTTIDGHASTKYVLQIPSNTEGHFMLIALNLTSKPPIIRHQDRRKTNYTYVVRVSKLVRAFAVAGMPLLMAIILQSILAYELYNFTEQQCRLIGTSNLEDFHMPYLQCCCLLLWWTDMSTEIHSLVNNSMIIFARRFRRDDKSRWKLQISLFRRIMVLFVSVITELVVWIFVMLVGTKFITYCAVDVEALVMNCLAIKFICECDEIISNAMVPRASIQIMEQTTFYVSKHKSNQPFNVFSLYFKIPTLAFFSAIVIYSQSPYVEAMVNKTNSSGIIDVWFREVGLIICFMIIFCLSGICVSILKSQNAKKKKRRIRPSNP